MFAAWDDPAAADSVLRDALDDAVREIEQHAARLVSLREEALRTALFEALWRRVPGHVRKERHLKVPAFRGAGGSDVLVDRVPERRVAWLAETKWSYTDPPKVFEAVWDAIKLCLQIREHGVARGWVIVGASDAAWGIAEGSELFTPGSTDTLALWKQPLAPPRSPNYGKTIGEDLIIGGNGNRPTTVPRRIHSEAVATIPLDGDERWTVRAIAVTPDDEWIADFAPPPEFPSPVTRAWLQTSVPTMNDAVFEELVVYLRQKRWSRADIEQRVRALRRDDRPPEEP
jgi:hypothetical protein